MKIINTIKELKEIRSNISKSVGFVPTMGALHQGHISLIEKSVKENYLTIVSIFINPTQFAIHEDFDKYPQTLEDDILYCKKNNVDILFVPDINEMYSKDEILIKAPSYSGYILEGYLRPTHFNGMLQIVLKLLNLTKATNAYFGKKDAQQLLLIKKMVTELFLDTNIIECEIIRESNGLALSSRNIYLTQEQKDDALYLFKSLQEAKKMIDNGELNIDVIYNEIKNILLPTNIEYIAILKRDFSFIKEIVKDDTIILLSIKFGDTRLIDNLWI